MTTPANTSVNDFRIKLLKDAVLIREGEEGTEFFLLETGVVDIYIQGRKISSLDAKNSQEFLGEVASLLGGKRTATIIAATDCSLLRIPQMKLDAILTSSPSLGLKLIRSLCRKLSLSAKQHATFQTQQQNLLKSGSTEVSLRNYMKGLCHLFEDLEKNANSDNAKKALHYFRATNPWKIQHGDPEMILKDIPPVGAEETHLPGQNEFSPSPDEPEPQTPDESS